MNRVRKLSCGLVCIAAVAAPMAVLAGSASLYVQDGLIACWDGIENAGKGVHDPAATVWKDLVAGREFALTGVTVNDDRMTFAGSATSYGTLSGTDTTSTFVAAKSGTMEIVYASPTIVSGQNYQLLLQSTASSGLAFGLFTSSSIITYTTSTTTGKPVLSFTSGTATNSVSVRYSSCVPASAIANGESRTLSGANYWGTPDASQTFIGVRASKANNTHFPGSIYCIRLYNRQLSDAEIVANHTVDDMRFRGGGFPDDTLAVLGDPGRYGTPSPAYGNETGLSSGGTVAVSCSSYTNTEQMIEYLCTGWNLYDKDGNVLSNGTENAFTYVHPTPAEFRILRWQWSVRKLSTVSDATMPVAGAAFHVDASMPSTLTTVESGGKKIVTAWCDADGGLMKATAGSSSRPWLVTDDGFPYVDFGPQTKGNGTAAGDTAGHLTWSSQLTTIREVFLVFSDYPGSAHSFFLGDSSVYHFHRNQNKLFNTTYASAYVQNGLIEVDGVVRDVNYSLPSGFHIIHLRTTGDVTANRFAQDRTENFGGQRLQEVIVYTRTLTDAEAEATYDYLEGKWFSNPCVLEVDGAPEQLGSPSPAYGGHVGLAAGEQLSVSCGAPIATNDAGTVYGCGGWKIYDKDDNEIASGTETSFVYAHPTPAAFRRVEWQWVEPLAILPIPDQVNETFDPSRPEFVVSNRISGATWTVGGDVANPLFDVEYANNDGAGTATATVVGKGEYEGCVAGGSFNIVATKYEDENLSTTDLSSRRAVVDGKCVYIFKDGSSAQTVTAKRGIVMTDYLLVGGGGGGGRTMAGGGGGGGVTSAAGVVGATVAKGGTFTLTVGAGGAGSRDQSVKGGHGGMSSLLFGAFTVSVPGGGGGGSWNSGYQAGAAGASGGGGCQTGAGGAGIEGFGFAGAAGGGQNSSASGGGGGAGHAGYAADTTAKHAGYGGEGVSNNITGAWVVYGGGGGGGGSNNGYNNYTAGLGGLGGGGDGSRTENALPGTDGLGGGGGGGGYSSAIAGYGGSGGSGTVIFAIVGADFEVDPIPDQYMTTAACEPLPVVRDGETLLVNDVDYTVSYANNDQSGIALLTITGVNDYAGKSVTVSFKIVSHLFADPSAPTGGDGRSWASALSVADAFAAAAVETGVREIWIKSGTVSRPAISIVNNGALTVRGGFAGTEATLADRQPGGFTIFDGESSSSILLTIDNATDDDIVLDRIKFCRARSNGFVKTGKGGLKAYDCAFETNGRNVSEVYGRGMNAQSDGYGSLVVSNCVFAGNRCVNADKQWGGFGLYVKNFNDALIDDSLFVTNGYDLTKTPSSAYVGYLNARGSALLVDSTPITIRNSRFAGNCCPVRKKDDTYWCGGTIALNGACGGSVIDHCALIGNTEIVSAGDEGSNSGGAIAIRLNASAAKVAVRNCTIAYNLTQSPYSSGGITVYKGAADISNTILWKNLRYHTTTAGYGKDLHVTSSGSARIGHSLVTSLDANDECVVGATVDAASVFALDPKLVTSTAGFESLLTQNATGPYYKPTTANPAVYEDLASMDAHLRSAAGYFVNGGAEGPATSDYSPAIDMGDPDADYANEPSPNGARLNLGAYGNTAEASSSAFGQPEATVEVFFPDGEARPAARITMGIESGDGYIADVHVLCSSEGVVLAESTFTQVVSGDVIELKSPSYLPLGKMFDVAVTIAAPGAETRYYNESEPVSGAYPPFYGKGGGPNVVHVRTGADGLMDGSNWEHAFPNLRAAFASVPDETKTEMWLSVTNDYMQTAVTLAHPLTIRGGFTGTENYASERPEGILSTLDGFNCNYKTMDFSVPSGALLTVERIRFSRSSGSGIKKTGAGDLTVRDCYFTDRKQSDWNLQGGGIYATGGTVSIANCQFVNLIDYSVNALSYSWHGGDGIYLSSCTQAYVDDCLFATNGIQFYRNKGAQARHTGSAAYISATPTIFRNCRFASNGAAIMEAADSAGTIHFKGASGGSKLINCALVGNSDFEGSQSAADPTAGGTIICNMSTTNATLDIENCTIAYNLTQGRWTGAGINVCKGTVNLKNSIVYGNVRNRNSDTVNAGADIEVKSNATLTVSYTLVTGLESNYVHAVEGGTINIGEGVITDDPLLTTTTNDFQSLFSTKDSGGLPYLPQSARAACAALDVHPRTRTGYMLDGVLIKDPVKDVESPTIDAGDKESDYSLEPVIPGVGGNGHRVNLGAYGNTSEAALTRARGFHLFLR